MIKLLKRFSVFWGLFTLLILGLHWYSNKPILEEFYTRPVMTCENYDSGIDIYDSEYPLIFKPLTQSISYKQCWEWNMKTPKNFYSYCYYVDAGNSYIRDAGIEIIKCKKVYLTH